MENRKQNTTESVNSRRKKRWLRACIIACSVIFFVVGVLGVLQLGCSYTANTLHFWTPDYEERDITALLEQQTLSDEDYELIYRQTGLTKLAVDDMRGTVSGRRKIQRIQTFFFQEKQTFTYKFGPFTYMEELVREDSSDYAVLADLQDGDILVSSTMRFSWWRLGHCALVVDADESLIIEAVSPGEPSDYNVAQSFSYRGNFIILRPKADEKTKAEVVAWAKENLVGLPYRFAPGIIPKKYNGKKPEGTQCAHIVWYAYKKFGVDLDYNGGPLVVGRDMFRSDKVEIVQVFGFDLDKLWQ